MWVDETNWSEYYRKGFRKEKGARAREGRTDEKIDRRRKSFFLKATRRNKKLFFCSFLTSFSRRVNLSDHVFECRRERERDFQLSSLLFLLLARFPTTNHFEMSQRQRSRYRKRNIRRKNNSLVALFKRLTCIFFSFLDDDLPLHVFSFVISVNK